MVYTLIKVYPTSGFQFWIENFWRSSFISFFKITETQSVPKESCVFHVWFSLFWTIYTKYFEFLTGRKLPVTNLKKFK